jgi:hypothetical protein
VRQEIADEIENPADIFGDEYLDRSDADDNSSDEEEN